MRFFHNYLSPEALMKNCGAGIVLEIDKGDERTNSFETDAVNDRRIRKKELIVSPS